MPSQGSRRGAKRTSLVERTPDYVDVELSTGKTVRVHKVVETLIQSILPDRPRPRRPTVDMDTAAGSQKRASKSGDAGYAAYEAAKAEWEQERDDLREAVTMVMALRDELPGKPGEDVSLEWPPDAQLLIDAGLTKLPDNIWLRQYMWLKAAVLISVLDSTEIDLTLQHLSGVPLEVTERMKENFRRRILGEDTERVGADIGDTN